MNNSEQISASSNLNTLEIKNKSSTGFLINSQQDLISIANILIASDCIPLWHYFDESNSPRNRQGIVASVVACLIKGIEIGLPIMSSIQFITKISRNSGLTIWGEAAFAVVMQHPQFEDIEQSYDDENKIATCILKRKNRTPVIKTFSLEDAKKAKLDLKDNYQKYLQDMLHKRAFARAAKVAFPDSFIGYITEEFFESNNVIMDVENKTIEFEKKSIENKTNDGTIIDNLNLNDLKKEQEEIING